MTGKGLLTKHDKAVNYSSDIIPKKRMDELKHQDIIIGELGINQTDSNLLTHPFRTNLFVAW